MADQKTKKKQNSVHIVGYLKENNLEVVTNRRGEETIRGSIVVATSDIGSHKIQFYVSSKTSNGEDSKDYTNLLELLPDKATSIASFLKDNPGSSFEMASNASTKIWVQGRFEEYATRVGERSRSMALLKGFKAGLKEATDTAPFKPHAEFTVDIYVKDLQPEVVDEEETGRMILTGLLPMYDESVQQIDFIVPVENGIAEFVRNEYKPGYTTTVKGEIVSLMKRDLVENSGSDEFFGMATPQYETTFIRERIVRGISKTPIKQGEDGAITNEFVKNGLAKREVKMDENGKKMSTNQNNGSQEPKPAASKPAPSFSDDIDF